MLPDSISYILHNKLKIVVLPSPLFPTIPYVLLSLIVKFRLFNTNLSSVYPNLTLLNSNTPLQFSI